MKESTNELGGCWVACLTVWEGSRGRRQAWQGLASRWHTLPSTGSSQAAAQLAPLLRARLEPGPPARLPSDFLPWP